MSILIWFVALLALISGATWFVLGAVGGGLLYLIVGMVNLLLAVVQARYGVARILHAFAQVVEDGEALAGDRR